MADSEIVSYVVGKVGQHLEQSSAIHVHVHVVVVIVVIIIVVVIIVVVIVVVDVDVLIDEHDAVGDEHKEAKESKDGKLTLLS